MSSGTLPTHFPAMVLAAGLGKRMRPYTQTMPKPLVPIAGQPLIAYSFRLLRNAGMKACVVNTHYLADQMETYLTEQTGSGTMQVSISHEPELLETGGGIMQALPKLDNPFFVLNSDVICVDTPQPVLYRMRQQWDAATMDALLLLQPVEKATGYEGAGDFSLLEDGRIVPRMPGQQAYVFTGAQLLGRNFLQDVPQGAFSLSLLYRRYLEQGHGRLRGIVHQGDWFHVGDPEGVAAAERALATAITA